MFKKLSLPLQLILVIGIVIIFGQFFNANFVSASYTFSLIFKEILGLFLPLIVFSFILGGILSFKKNAPLILLILLIAIVCSNCLVATLAFFTGTSFMPWITGSIGSTNLSFNDTIQPFFYFKIPSLVSAEVAMLSAIFIGLFFSYKRNPHITLAAQRLKNTVERILNSIFIPLLPFYVFGFLAKLSGVRSSLAHLAVPIAANVHLLGDAITTPILSLVTMYIFFGTTPAISSFLVFVVYFCMAMLATSGVPGGGIIVVIPLLKSIFGFTPEMISIITTLYLLQDGLGTAGNVMGDGALTIFVDKLLKKIGIETD